MTPGASETPGRLACVALVMLFIAGCSMEPATAEPVPVPKGPGGTPPIEIRAHSVNVPATRLAGLRQRGTISLNARNDSFGGFSGLKIEDGHLIAISDAGWWLLADLSDDSDGLRPKRAGYAPMREPDGTRLDSGGRDAEDLTARDGTLLVSFERDHRIMTQLESGGLGNPIRDSKFDKLGYNQGLEALATTPDGSLIAIAEAPDDKGHPMFRIRSSGKITEHRLPAIAPFHVTGADVGPDGRLYALRRHYARLVGVSARIHRYDLNEEGLPDPASVIEMAAFESHSGIDNMEGISVWRDSAGATRLALISDDNFNLIQRTLLMDFDVLD